MSHFAQINNEGIVQRVIVAEQDFINSRSSMEILLTGFNVPIIIILGNSFLVWVISGIMLIKYL